VGDKVYFNGKIMETSEAVIPAGDRAVLFGDSIFETVRAYGGTPFRLARHLERLEDSARTLRLSIPLSPERITEAVLSLLTENGLSGKNAPDARVRVTVSGGTSDGPKGLERPGPAGIFITASRLVGFPESWYREGIVLAVSGLKRNTSSPLSAIKSGNYLDSMLARQDALDRGADDAVMLTTAGNLSEATSSNLFMAKEGEILTPDVGCGLLPGVTREAVIELCGRLEVRCRPITQGPDVLFSCDEVFLTNSIAEVLPVKKVGDRAPAHGCPGPVTAQLSAAYRQLVEDETGIQRAT